jgi:ubiquitin-protein ligase
LKTATDDLVAFACPDGIKRFPNADLRILVISDGEDLGSTATAVEALQAMLSAKIVCDSVVISTRDECKSLCAISHMTGGVSFRPETVNQGLQLFEQEAFLCYKQRRKRPHIRGSLSEEEISQAAATDSFDTAIEASVIITATVNLSIATPRYVIAMNQSGEIPDARRRRILRELHRAAAVQQVGAIGREPSGREVPLYDSDLRIYTSREKLDEWRVYIKGLEGTPYAGKWWYLFVTFPDEYPIRPPIFRFISIPYHMNVSSDGRICLNVIEKGYQETMPIVELVQMIKQLFLFPDLTTVLDINKYFQYQHKRPIYDRLAAKSAHLYAKDSVEEWISGRTVEDDASCSALILVGEQIPPYLRSAYTGKYIPTERQVRGPRGIVYDQADLKSLAASAASLLCPITGKPLGDFVRDFV